MGKDTPKPPPSPNPAALAQAQGAANREAVEATARYNQINQQTPFGNLTYTGELGSPERTVTQTLAPEDQARLGQQRELAGSLTEFANTLVPQVTNRLGTPLTFEGLPTIPSDYSEARDAATEASYARLTNLIRPDIEQGRDRLQTTLSNQGIPITSEAYDKATGRFERNAADAFLNAANQAVLTGQGEAAQQFAQALTGRQQGISERLTERAQPINEIAAVLQGAPATNLPTFQPTNAGQVQPADVIGANTLAQSANLAAYNAANQRQAATTGGIAGILGAGVSALPWFFI